MTSLLLLLVGAWLWAWPCSGALTITCPWGTVSGVTWSTPSGANYSAYLAIPYALPPVGERRFQKPQPHPRMKHTHSATQFGPACMQANNVTGPSDVSEDCLTLNLFVPDREASGTAGNLSVLVWLHGGSFVMGSARQFDPVLLLDNHLLVVTVQYRLGPFGFLSTGDESLGGNYGLWDQVLALTWVKDNILDFGGDPGRVTVMGESAGGASVTLLNVSPRTSGLFHRVISQSGAAGAFWTVAESRRALSLSLAVGLGCLQNPSQYPEERDTMLSCLRNKSADTIINVARTLMPALWSPVVDGDLLPALPSLLLHNASILESVGFFSRDLMLGVNSNEGAFLSTQMSPEQLTNASVYRATVEWYLSLTFGSHAPAMADLLEFHYSYPRLHRAPDTILPQAFFDTAMDFMFMPYILAYTRAHAQRPKGAVRSFLYLFNYSACEHEGTVHGRDTALLFPYTAHTENMYLANVGISHSLNAEDEKVGRSFARFLSDFAKTGNPVSPDGAVPDWPEFDSLNESYLAFDGNSSVHQHLYSSRVSLFLDVLPRMQQRWLDRQASQPSTQPLEAARLRRFPLDVTQAEYLIIALLASTSLLLVLFLAAAYSACSQKAYTRKDKYRMNKI